ncbi:hypothetical protein LIER_41657 [Lithospermum erythrorhizon]|uniref:F-box associated beta-propeller type 1 domain-containing protein n=1 Tax=Lithospermum erythrorhizon TaxID=34254 RepID=A0AAV3RCR0_LITER
MLSSDTLDTNGIWYCGFGHDGNDDHKVIVICYSCESPGSPFKSDFSHVYSLKTNSWKEVERCPYSVYGFMVNIAAITACGAIHFIAYEDMIASFDLAKEEYKVVPKPDVNIADDALVTLSLGTLGGCLCLTYKEYIFVFHEIWSLWLLKEYGNLSSWTNIAKVRPSEGIGSLSHLCLIDYSDSEKELILQDKFSGSMVRYYIENGLAKKVKIEGKRKRKVVVYSHVYQESLVQLKNGDPSVSWEEFGRE